MKFAGVNPPPTYIKQIDHLNLAASGEVMSSATADVDYKLNMARKA